MKILIKGARVIDPANKRDALCDLLLEKGRISKIGKKISCAADKQIDAKDKVVIPGLVDMHVHLREPGREDKETVASATAAALRGGVTSVLAMPNTNPAIDRPEQVDLLKQIIAKSARANVLISAAITVGRQGEKLTEFANLKSKGAVAITDDGFSVDDDQLMLRALRKAKANKLLTICHSEDKALSKDGVVNRGIVATRMGLRGISSESEHNRVERDIKLAAKAKAAVHIAHVSCRQSVEIIAGAKRRGLQVSAETAPHYFSLSDEDATGFDTNMKVNPPLRSGDDLQAIKQGLRTGVIDAIASDHAPHTVNEKDIEFDRAAFGMIGLETLLSLGLTELVEKKILTLPQLIEKITVNPAKILGIAAGSLSLGSPADLVIFDPSKEWLVKRQEIVSKSKNSPFIGRTLKGLVEYTIHKGQIVYKAQ
ncbi:MAG: dihydroorotase [Candidatus Omnitrophica bacterium]|nr:dihydroorotase [Candidatus Omnitrophota bacterium]